MSTRATGAGGMRAAEAAPRRAIQAASTPPAPANRSRRLIRRITLLPGLVADVASAAAGDRRSVRLRQPWHLALPRPGDVVDAPGAALEHGDTAVLGRHEDAGHSRLVEGAGRRHV